MKYNDNTSEYRAHSTDSERPFFSKTSFDRKLAYGRRQTLTHAQIIGQEQNDPFKAGELKTLIRTANLTSRQLEVIRLRVRGQTFEQIGQKWNRTKQGAQRVYQQAVKKLRRAKGVYPYAGLNEVYRQEIHRGAFR